MQPHSFLSLCPQVICFDADDTLWLNEKYYQAAEEQFCRLLSDYRAHEDAKQTLYEAEMRNLDLLGYGSKSFTISMIEAALEITQSQLPNTLLKEFIDLGKSVIAPPMELLPNVRETLEKLAPHYRLALATKGDLRDQERKLQRSGLCCFFEYVSILSEKNRQAYEKILKDLSLTPPEFMMIGNSFKSDILPVLEIGAQAVYIPSAILWVHEYVEPVEHAMLKTIEHIGQLPELLL
ncbi:MAG: HAD family hydrolase [Bacteroidales bacterium]|nr:HAD family hydrolase [Bacteroidales bacterium]